MKRLVLALIPLVITMPAMAFRPLVNPGQRVAVLRPIPIEGQDSSIAIAVTRSLQKALRARGIDAVDAGITFDEQQRNPRVEADFFVEVVSTGADGGAPVGGVGVNGHHVGVDISVLVSRVAAELRVYEGRTLDLVRSYDMHRSSTTVMPTSIGVNGYPIGFWVALPFVNYARYRAAARAVAADAASVIVGETRRE